MKLIKAKEARQIALEAEYAFLCRAIKKEAKGGEHSVLIEEELFPENLYLLTERGYEVYEYPHGYKISWEQEGM